ncbi:MAG: DUF4412 domain-containing protein [Bacteroidetes bacterium]|jgi:hypothetical protein|nr:DUF4412 domain-containing protein [Bacteroidota bacterium]MDF1865440.1 DUF4412 domain-containing protein [Saprospiraceae bacterium]
MKTILKSIFCLLLFLSMASSSDAQIFKKLERKINQKLNRKIDQEIDQEIDKVFEPKENNEVQSSGIAIIRHENSFGSINIEELSQPIVERNNKGYTINLLWRSHEVDIFDGISLQIKTTKNIRHDEKDLSSRFTFKIPEEASLKIAYDPQLPFYKKDSDNFKRGVSDDYQNYDFLKGTVTIDALDAENIQISFSGKGELRKINRQDNQIEESFYQSTLTGAIDATQPIFRNNISNKKPTEETRSVTSWDDMVPKEEQDTSTPGSYNFTFQTDVLVTVPGEEKAYKISYLLNPEANYAGIKANLSDYDASTEGTSIIVTDGDASHIFVETAGMKIQMSQSMMQGKAPANLSEEMANYDYTQIKKTGKTKSILGAQCYEYTMSDDNVEMVLWVAPEVNIPNWFIQNESVIDGHIMEYTMTSKDGTAKSTVITIHDNISQTINAKDYKKMF